MATIVQEYGPIYGEAVNGTVQGRPNGSVYVPSTNTITLYLDGEAYAIRYSGKFVSCKAGGLNLSDPKWGFNAIAQDLASCVEVCMYSDSALTNLVGSRTIPAGQFNSQVANITIVDDTGLSAGDPLYLIAHLVNNGTVIAVSNVETLELVS